MTNEELVIKIQTGQTDLIKELWINIEKFVYAQAKYFFKRWQNRCQVLGLETEDLYQSAFLSLNSAIEYYNAEKGAKFLSVYGLFLKSEFSKAIKVRYEKHKRICKNIETISLDSYIDANLEIRFLDTLIDESAEEAFNELENEECRQLLHTRLESALPLLTESEYAVIKKHYYDNKPMSDIAKELGIIRTYGYQIRRRAFGKIKKCLTV